MTSYNSYLFFYDTSVLPADGSDCIVIQKRANGEVKYALSFYFENTGWYTDDQAFEKKPEVIAWSFLQPIPTELKQ